MNKVVIAVPIGLVLLLAAALLMRRGPLPPAAVKPVRPEPSAPLPVVLPSEAPRPMTPPALTSSADPVMNEIKTELGVALNALRTAKRQVEVLARATEGGKTLGERLQTQSAEFANLRLGATVERLPAALSALPQEKAEAVATTLSSIQRALGDLELQAQQLLTTIAGLRQRPGFESDQGLVAAEGNVAALRSMVGVAAGRVSSEIARLRNTDDH